MGYGTAFALATLGLLIAIMYPNVSTSIVNLGTFDPIRHQQYSDCYFEQSEELSGCENGQVDFETGISYLACAKNLTERRKWFPPTGSNDKSIFSHGGITLYNFKTGSIEILELEGLESEFQPHGLGIIEDPEEKDVILIAAVNHIRTGSVIEQFSHKRGSSVAKHYNTVKLELLNNPNDVQPLSRHAFYATNDIRNEGIWKIIEKYGRKPWAYVVHYEDGAARKVAQDLSYANGITLSKDKVYVTSSVNRHLRIYERKDDDGLKLLDIVPIGQLADNISIDKATGAVYVTGHQNGFKFMDLVKNANAKSPSVVTKIQPNKAKDQFYGKKV
jgi:arylesterase / paraoxonase